MSWDQGHLLKSGQYEIIRLLGSGGFGMTYLAKDLNLERQVVIKRPNLSFEADRDYDKFLRRFKREGQVLAQVQITHIVRVIEFTEIEGMPCLVMDFVAGETLNECIRRRQSIPENEALQLFQKLAIAVETLHQKGIIHCDIHPGNIIVQPNGEPMLIDFGSTKLLHPTTWTVTTTVNKDFGPYEQMDESDENTLGSQPDWDIYSLAANMYFAVTGQKPMSAISRKLYGDGLKAPKELKPELSDRLNNMILQGMALEAKVRPSSVMKWIRLLNAPQQPLPKDKTSDATTKSISQKHQSESFVPKAPKPIKTSTLLPKKKTKLAFPWIAISSLVFVYFLQGIVLGNHGEAWAWTLAWILALAGAWATAGSEAWAWIWAWLEDKNRIRDLRSAWLIITTLTGTLSSGGLTGSVTGTGIIWGLCYGVFAWYYFITMVVGYDRSQRILKKSYSDIQIFFIYGVFSSFGLISGGILGSWLKAAGIFKFS